MARHIYTFQPPEYSEQMPISEHSAIHHAEEGVASSLL
jgi:hypothetical protein